MEVINKIVGLSLITTLCFLSGCFLISSKYGPGYGVSLVINGKAVLNSDEIARIELLAKRERFDRVKEVSLSDERRVIYYYRKLEDRAFDAIHYKFIDLDLFYAKNEGDRNVALKKIRISNNGEGYSEPLKSEIDRIAKLFTKVLEERIDAKDIHIERFRTGPPM